MEPLEQAGPPDQEPMDGAPWSRQELHIKRQLAPIARGSKSRINGASLDTIAPGPR